MEIKDKLKQQYPYRIELHAHTSPVSACSQITPKEMIETYRSFNYDGIVITNHFSPDFLSRYPKEEIIDRYLADFYETKEIGAKEGIKVYLGAEVRFTENHNDYLIYGANEEIIKKVYEYIDKGLEIFRKEVLLPDSLLIQAHPNRDGMTKISPDLLDGMEILNLHPGHNSRNPFTERIVRDNPHLIPTAGTDYHHSGRGHEAISALRSQYLPEDSFGIADILKSRDYLFEVVGNTIIIP
jgi:hypothetical protein